MNRLTHMVRQQSTEEKSQRALHLPIPYSHHEGAPLSGRPPTPYLLTLQRATHAYDSIFYRAFHANEPGNCWLICGKRPATYGFYVSAPLCMHIHGAAISRQNSETRGRHGTGRGVCMGACWRTQLRGVILGSGAIAFFFCLD